MKITQLVVRRRRILSLATCESAFAIARVQMQNLDGTMGVFTRNVPSIPSGKILDKNCESLYWWQTFR